MSRPTKTRPVADGRSVCPRGQVHHGREPQVLSPKSGMRIGRQPIQWPSVYLTGLLCVGSAVVKLTAEGHWSWWRVLLPLWVVLGRLRAFPEANFGLACFYPCFPGSLLGRLDSAPDPL